jgi:hypothetical protein
LLFALAGTKLFLEGADVMASGLKRTMYIDRFHSSFNLQA